MRTYAQKKRSILVRHIVGIVISILFVLPVLLMVTGSLRQAGSPPPRTPEFLPDPVSLSNYTRTVELVDMPHYTLNSFKLAVVVVPLSVLFSSLAGFALSRVSKVVARRLVLISLAALMIPSTAFFVGRFVLFSSLGMTDTYWPLVIPAFMGLNPLFTLLFYWSFRRLPNDLFETCLLEGISLFKAWWKVAMPLVKPTTMAVGALAFVATWSDFLNPLIYLSSERLFTASLGLRSLATLDMSDQPLFLAGAVIVTIPALVLFFFAQRYLTQKDGRV